MADETGYSLRSTISLILRLILTVCLWHASRAVVAWAWCIVTHVPRATCMQTRILSPLCKMSVRRRRGKKVHERFFDHCFEWHIHLRAHRLFVPSLKSARTIEFDEMFTYLCRLLFLSSAENIRRSRLLFHQTMVLLLEQFFYGCAKRRLPKGGHSAL